MSDKPEDVNRHVLLPAHVADKIVEYMRPDSFVRCVTVQVRVDWFPGLTYEQQQQNALPPERRNGPYLPDPNVLWIEIPMGERREPEDRDQAVFLTLDRTH